jgi:hypothetical protein
MRKYFTALAEIFKFNQLLFKKNWLLFAVLLVPFLIIDHRVIDIDLVDAYDVDEFFFLKILYSRQFYGFNHLDVQKFFSGFYSYGRPFWIINFIATYIPFAFHKYNTALFVSRIISSLFAIQGFLIFKETLYQLTRSKVSVITISILTLLMTYFWAAGSWLHPDWLMMYFMLLAFHYFFTSAKHGNYTSQAFLMALAIAVGVKVQSLQFMPLLALYYAKPFFVAPSVKTFISAVKQNLIAVLVIGIVFLALNPYLLHPKGFPLFAESFAKDMASNKDNNGAGYIPTFNDKVNVFAAAYLSQWIVALVALLSLWFAVFSLKNFKEQYEKLSFILTTAVVIAYYIFMVNKAWPHYYLPIPFMILLLVAFVLPALFKKIQMLRAALGILIILQIISTVVHFNYFMDWAQPQRRLSRNHNYEKYKVIAQTLNQYPDCKNASVMFTYDLPIPVNACHLDFNRVSHSPAPTLTELRYVSHFEPNPVDYLVIEKSKFYRPGSNQALPGATRIVALIDSIKAGQVSDFKAIAADSSFVYIKRVSK